MIEEGTAEEVEVMVVVSIPLLLFCLLQMV